MAAGRIAGIRPDGRFPGDDARGGEDDGGVGEVTQERREPAGLGDDVGVEERDELAGRGGGAGVAGGGGAARDRVADHARAVVGGHARRGVRVRRAVVDDDHLGDPRRGRRQRTEQAGELAGTVAHGHDHRDRGGRRGVRVAGLGVGDAGIGEQARQRRGRRVGDREPRVRRDPVRAGEAPVRRGREVQHARRRAPDQRAAAVGAPDATVQHDRPAVRGTGRRGGGRGADGGGADGGRV